MRLPRAMSTQHPDNATPPAFAENGVLMGEGEVEEACYVYGTLGCDEQMWDFEGKAADVDVVLKLLLKEPEYFRSHVLGEEIRLTLRIPNPVIEREMRKKVEEALHTIVTGFDVASSFYDAETSPISEVILPFTSSADELLWLDSYYREVVVGKERHILPGGRLVSQWVGEHRPKVINIIPLVEDEASLLGVDSVVGQYVTRLDRPLPYVRVFLARSDPALNYGLAAAVLLVKVALQRLQRLEGRLGIPIYPILGVGSSPFRGNFRPPRVKHALTEFPSVQTYTVQSSFKYDYEIGVVRRAIEELLARPRLQPIPVDEERAQELIERVKRRYQEQVALLANLVNALAPCVPRRRDRRLHIGLFGYSRELDDGNGEVRLPRAITFAAALYSVGLPPELLGLDSLTDSDREFLFEVAPCLREDLADALQFANEANVRQLLGEQAVSLLHTFGREVSREHRGLTTLIYDCARDGLNPTYMRQLVEGLLRPRKFLG